MVHGTGREGDDLVAGGNSGGVRVARDGFARCSGRGAAGRSERGTGLDSVGAHSGWACGGSLGVGVERRCEMGAGSSRSCPESEPPILPDKFKDSLVCEQVTPKIVLIENAVAAFTREKWTPTTAQGRAIKKLSEAVDLIKKFKKPEGCNVFEAPTASPSSTYPATTPGVTSRTTVPNPLRADASPNPYSTRYGRRGRGGARRVTRRIRRRRSKTRRNR